MIKIVDGNKITYQIRGEVRMLRLLTILCPFTLRLTLANIRKGTR